MNLSVPYPQALKIGTQTMKPSLQCSHNQFHLEGFKGRSTCKIKCNLIRGFRGDASEQGCNSWNVKNAILDSGKQQSLGSMQQMTKKCNMGLEKCWKMEKVQFYIQAQKTLGCTAQSHKNLAMHLKWGQRLWRQGSLFIPKIEFFINADITGWNFL